jgi:hypothetical protein
MNRQQRRHIDREMKRLAEKDLCSLCNQHFPHNSRTFFGLCRGRMALACERCADNIEEVYAAGIVAARNYDFLAKGTKNHGDEGKKSNYGPEEIAKVIGAFQEAIQDADQTVGDAERRGGALKKRRISTLDYPWKDDDREWFKIHPERSHRVRLPHPDEGGKELGPVPDGHVLIVIVRQVQPGIRMKNAFYLEAELWPVPEDEAVAHALFDLVEHRRPFSGAELGTLIMKYQTTMQT